MKDDVVILINQKIDKVIYQMFSDLITDNIVNNSTTDILNITKNNNGEILLVNYNLEKTYKLLTNVSSILKENLNDFEKGKININLDDNYLLEYDKGLVLFVPLYLNNNNVFINKFGPKIPIVIDFNNSLLTNVKTKITDYGLNNCLLEMYITIRIDKTIITPLKNINKSFNYDILISSIIINGSVPKIYGTNLESSSSILDIPMN